MFVRTMWLGEIKKLLLWSNRSIDREITREREVDHDYHCALRVLMLEEKKGAHKDSDSKHI